MGMLCKPTGRIWLVSLIAVLCCQGLTLRAQNSVTNGLVAYWSFDDNLLDSVNAFHGTARGTQPIPFVDGKTGFGKAIKLDGTDQFVEITGGNEDDLEFPGGSMSIAGWFKVDAFDTDWQALISKGENSNYRVARSSSTDSISYAGGATDTPAGTPVNDGAWHQFVAVTDATATDFGTALYIDGVLDSTVPDIPVLASNSQHLMIGENPDARGREWEGEIDDIGIWNRVLTADEVATLFASGTGLPLSSILPTRMIGIFVSSLSQRLNSFAFTVNDAEGSVVDPATATLTLDGQPAPVTFTATTNGTTTFTHTQSTPWATGSQHTYSIQVKDTSGLTLSQDGEFTLPNPWFPPEDLPSPAVVDKAWALRWVFGAGTLNDIPTVLATLQSVTNSDFAGAYVDTTNEVINFPETGGFFGNGSPYPDDVINDPSGLWIGDDFILFGVGHIQIPEEGDYTFGVHSDDGFGFRIRGGEAISVSGNGMLDPVDPEAVIHPNTTGDSNTRAVYHLKQGVYRVEFFWWERGGGDNGEFYAAKGAFANDADTDQWKLVGDNAPSQTFSKPGVDDSGWSVVSSDPGGDPLTVIAEGMADLDATAGAPKTYDALNVGDPDTNAGVAAFPKDTPGVDDDSFALRATAMLVAPVAGDYEIGFNSDDGGWMTMTGQTFTEILQNATGLAVIDPADTVTTDALTGTSLTTVKVTLSAGSHPIEIGFFDSTGGGYVRGIAAQFGSPFLPTITKGGSGMFNTPEALHLTDAPTSVSESLEAAITRSGTGVTIQWTPTGGTLETSPTLGPTANWTTVGTDNPANITTTTGNAYYRVRQ